MSLKYNKNLIPRAKHLRRNMTPQERHLWYDYLREYPIRFQRQKVIDSYIADFYCHRAKLVVEIDGEQHGTEECLEYDSIRTECLNSYGVEVVRFSNYEINTNFDGVCLAINDKVKERLLTCYKQSGG